jgi:signal transduction histidine kinase
MANPRILLVEDEPVVALNLRMRLEKLGYTVSAVAASGTQALARIEATRPDLVLMDINIEGPLDGIATASAIPDKYHIPVIYLTAFAEESTIKRARETHPYGYLIKPFSERELHAMIQLTLERCAIEAALRASQARLLQAQKLEAIGALTGRIAHDFNNILGVITLGLDFVLADKDLLGRARPMIQESLDAANRGADLIRSLLCFARRQPLQPDAIDINARLNDLQKMLIRVLGADVVVTLTLAPDLWLVSTDRAQFEACIVNFATNARDAMPKGGSLTIVTANRHVDAREAAANPPLVAGDYVTVDITDTGIGMTPEIQSRIFEPFFSTKPASKGTGLGLSGVLGFAGQSGGHVSVDSTPGQGTTFRLYLPRMTETRPDSADAGRQTERPPRGHDELVLVVEDIAALRKMVVRQLENIGYRVIQAESAHEALLRLQESPYVDLVFSDIVMPGGMDGFELAAEIRRQYPGIGLLLTSGFTEDSIDDRLVGDLASVQLLRKPYERGVLARAIRRILDERANTQPKAV